MPADINNCNFTGRLTRDSELKYTNSGTPVLNFSLAYTTSQGKGENRTDKSNFLECVVWGKFGESISQFLMKGTQIAVSGELDFEQWEKDGMKRSKHKLNVRSLRMMGGKKEGGYTPAETETGNNSSSNSSNFNEDDIPF
ncbi:single-stranded DNA-binding protein [Candidatus Pacearchaeota archaeon]|nr:single-stranded DNA-binding protein [Candidatus Pacearchaeota archaeon]